ncbi:MAG: CotH kinase family protein [Prevotellaceae bacterium]|nr:CotH kinase family protein [Prevotellaceae bacterium]
MSTKKFWLICIPVLTLVIGGILGAYLYRGHMLNIINNPPINVMPNDLTVKIDSTNLPIVFINTQGNTVERNEFVTSYVKIIDNGKKGLNYGDTLVYPNQKINYEGYMAIRYRGQSSYGVSDKKSYAIRAIDNPKNGKKKKSKLLGMRKGKKWILRANYFDKSMIRNTLTYTLAQSYMDFVPQNRFCEVIIDGIYHGVYSMEEQITADRLKLEKPGNAGNEITGGYLIEIGSCPLNEINLLNQITKNYEYKYPTGDKLSKEQEEYVRCLICKMDSSIYADNDSVFIANVDICSMIDYQLVSEFSHNGDAYGKSLFMYKYRDDKNSKWKFSIWDFDIAYGNNASPNRSNIDTWCYASAGFGGEWWQNATRHAVYNDACRKRWLQYRNGEYTDEHINHIIDSLTNVLTVCGAEQRNANAWCSWGRSGWNTDVNPQKFISTSYEEEIAYLKEWISRRLKWMDEELLGDE